MKLRTMLLIIGCVLALGSVATANETYKISVLAKRGPVKALSQWKATGDYLTAHVADKTFEIVPLDFDEVNPAIEANRVDFFLVNSSMFVTAKVTLRRRSRSHDDQFPPRAAVEVFRRCCDHHRGQ